jgi:hypothetical protein
MKPHRAAASLDAREYAIYFEAYAALEASSGLTRSRSSFEGLK